LSPGNADERHRVVAGAEDVDDTGVLQMPEQRAADDRPVHPPLEVGVGEGLQQGAGHGEVHPGQVLELP
jgi:hypothetical protein